MRARSTEARRLVASALSCLMLALGAAAVAQAHAPALAGVAHLPCPWWLLLLVYLLAEQVNLEFPRGGGSSVVLPVVQLPLALGAVLVAPPVHLAVRLASSVLDSLWHRRDRLKALVNVGVAALEVGLATLVLSAVAPVAPGPRLWLGLTAALLAHDLASHVGLNLVFSVLGMERSRHDLVEPLLSGAPVTGVFAGLSVLMLAAAWTDPWTLLAVLLLGVVLGLSYRAWRRLAVQQRATDELYAFVQGLGPVDVEQPEALAVLERVRELLHARSLELTASGDDGTLTRCLEVRQGAAPSVSEQMFALRTEGRGAAPDLRADRMTAPLVVGGALVGMLRARQRLLSDRGFDMKDLRLLETVASELATALDRGRLLRDLGRAALTDPTTGLPNLHRTTQTLDLLLHERSGPEDGLVVAAVAVDSFREVNETLGHEVGNDLLREVATRLRRAAPGAVVGRIGGGRFAVAVPASAAGDGPGWFGLSLRGAVEGTAQTGPVATHVRLSVGCASSPSHGTDAATLLRRAETAMYSARSRRGGPVLWEPAYEVQGQRRRAVVMALREALETGSLGVAFQPKVAARTLRPAGMEALARWSHPALGEVSPTEFVPLAGATGLLAPLTAFVLSQSLQACHEWLQQFPDVGVSVNVSADTLQDPAFVTEVAAQLRDSGVPPDRLTLELTEDVVVADPKLAARRMSELRQLGIRLSIDDFGTGYSSLTYLKGLPIDEVKIDKGFIAQLTADEGDQAVVRAVVDIAHTLGLRVVAEGVEEPDQHALVRDMGVDEEQGTLHAGPMTAVAAGAWLTTWPASGQSGPSSQAGWLDERRGGGSAAGKGAW